MNIQTDGRLPLTMSPFGLLVGIELVECSAGRARCQINLTARHMNTGGRVHGGVLSTLADTTAGLAVRTIRPEDKASATTDLNIAFIRPPEGNTIEATAEVIYAGKRLYRVEINLLCDDKLIARSNATFMLV